jgi:hypothetical protein
LYVHLYIEKGILLQMTLIDDIEKRIEKKREEIRDHELQIRDRNVQIKTLTEVLQQLPKELSEKSNGDQVLRPGTTIAKAREAIKTAGRRMHISDLVKAVGMPDNPQNRSSLTGTISAYVRDGEIFTRPAPNTFGLLELEKTGEAHSEPSVQPALLRRITGQC